MREDVVVDHLMSVQRLLRSLIQVALTLSKVLMRSCHHVARVQVLLSLSSLGQANCRLALGLLHLCESEASPVLELLFVELDDVHLGSLVVVSS